MNDTLKLIERVVVGSVFLTSLVALYVASTMFFPFITGKNFLFRILVEISFFGWIILALFDQEYRPRPSYISWSFIAVVAILFISALVGVNPERSFWSNFERMEGIITHLHLLAFFVVLISVFQTRERWRWYFHTSLGVALAISYYGMLQALGFARTFQGATRVEGTLGNATYLAVYLLFHIFITALLWRGEKKYNLKYIFTSYLIGIPLALYLTAYRSTIPSQFVFYVFFGVVSAALLFFYFRERVVENISTSYVFHGLYAFALIFQLIVLYLTATRGAILGLLGGIVIAGMILIASAGKRLRNAGIVFVVTVIIIVAGFLAVKDSSFVQENLVLRRFASLSFSERTVESRFIIWDMSLKGFMERPLLGYGLENYSVVFNKYYDPRLWRQEPWFDRAHNIIFDRLVASGIIGLAAYLALFVSSVYFLLRKKDEWIFERALLIGLLAAYFFQDLFVFDNITSYILFSSVLAYVHVNYAVLPPEHHFVVRLIQRIKTSLRMKPLLIPVRHLKIVLPSVGVIAFFVIFFLNVPAIEANRNLLRAITPRANLTESLGYFEKVFETGGFARYEATEHLLRFVGSIPSTVAVSPNIRQKLFEMATREAEQRILEDPYNARMRLFYATFLDGYGEYEKAKKYLDEARELSPKKQAIYFELASNAIGRKQLDEAIQYLETAYQLAPDYPEAVINLAVVYIFAGRDQEEVDALLLKHFATTTIADVRFVNAYSRSKRIDKVIDTWKAIIEQKKLAAESGSGKEDTQAYVSLAAAYFQAGNKKKAIEVLTYAKDLEKGNPTAEELLQGFIDDIKAGKNILEK